MIIRWYPDWTEDGQLSSVYSRLARDLKKRNDMMLRVETFLKKVKGLRSLEPLEKAEEIAPLGDGLYEMRIPKTLRGGVVRVYFCHAYEDNDTLIILDAELKHDKQPSKVDTARSRLRGYKEEQRRNQK